MEFAANWTEPKEDIKVLLHDLWNVEHFNMWNMRESAAVAYVLDRAYKHYPIDEYKHTVEYLFDWANGLSHNQFAFSMAFYTAQFMANDERIDTIDRKKAEQRFGEIQSDYKLNRAISFWMLDEKYAPDWFHMMWPKWVSFQENRMKARFIDSFKKLNWKNEDPEIWYNSFKNQDSMLLYELDQCLKHKRYKKEFALVYEGVDGHFVTAQELSKEFDNESIIAVYVRMFLLRK
jgi:hypothetical protein